MAFVRSTTFGGAAADATNYVNLLQLLVRFLTGVDAWTSTVTGGVLLHYVRGRASSVAETWTITCTNAGTGTFSVVGSVSGAKADATVGTPYDNGFIAFTLVNRTGAAVNGDVFTVNTYASGLAAAGQSWQLIRSTYSAPTYTYYLRGLGLAGTDEIYVNLRNYESVASDYYNIAITGASGHLLTSDGVSLQPNPSQSQHLCLLNSTIPYLFIADGRHFKGVARASTVSYESFFAGLFLPTGLPSEYPYPLAVGGSCSAANVRYNTSSGENGSYHRAFFNPNNGLSVLRKSGTWSQFQNYYLASSQDYIYGADTANYVSPWNESVVNRCLNAGVIDSSSAYLLRPAVLHSGNPNDVLGDLQGVYMIPGYTQLPENTTTIGGVDYFILPNAVRSGFNDFAAFKME